MEDRPSYHDLHVTTAEIPRTSIFNLPYGLQVTCSRVSGWQLWRDASRPQDWKLLAGEYDSLDKWLVLDVNGYVILDSRREADEDSDDPEPEEAAEPGEEASNGVV